MSSVESKEYFICPITLKLYNDPVLAEDGYTYEREAITQWIIQHGKSPRTKKPLGLNQLTPNIQVKNALENFKKTSRIDYGENAQALENLDVVCLYCGKIEKFNQIKTHKLNCPSNPDNIRKFQIGDDENIFTINPKNQSSSSSSRSKIFSFENPLSRQTINSNNKQTSIEVSNEDNRDIQLTKQESCSLLRNRLIQLIFLISFILILIGIIITLTYFLIKCQNQD